MSILWKNESLPSGYLDKSKMISIGSCGEGCLLIPPAAEAFKKLKMALPPNLKLTVSSAYRSYERQVSVSKGAQIGYAAKPGNSIHGWGRAIDISELFTSDIRKRGPNDPNFFTPLHQWLEENAPRFGFYEPMNRYRVNAGVYEPWHWQYDGNQNDVNIAVKGTPENTGSSYADNNNSTGNNTNANSQTNVESAPPGLDLQLEYASINAFLLTGQSISDASTGNKLKSQVNEKEEDQTIKTLTSPTHRIDPIISGTG